MTEIVASKNSVSSRLLSDDGIQVIKGGISSYDNFVSAVFKLRLENCRNKINQSKRLIDQISISTNLVNQSFALVYLVFIIYLLFFEYNNKDGPLEHLKDILKKLDDDTKIHATEKAFIRLLAVVVKTLITYKTYLIKFGLLWFVYMVKPSTNNMLVCIITSVMIIVLQATTTLLDVLFISQCHFLFTSLRAPGHKIFIFVLVIAYLFYDLEKLISAKTSSSGRPKRHDRHHHHTDDVAADNVTPNIISNIAQGNLAM